MTAQTYRIDRLINLSDGVIAIAVTLMILPLIDKASDATITSFASLMQTSGQGFLVFFISFAVICKFWLAHHSMFRSLKKFDAALFWLNSLWLLAIVVIPFTTELIGRQSGSDTSFVLGVYIGLIAITAWIGVAIEYKIARSPELQSDDTTRSFAFIPYATTALLATVALVIAVVFPAIGAWALLILFFTGTFNRLATRGKSA